MSRKSKGPKIYMPPTVIAGELLSWKGHHWRVQAMSPNGGEVILKDEKGEQRGIAQNAVIMLEMVSETTGAIKRQEAAKKRSPQVYRKGFRPRPMRVDRPEILVPKDKQIEVVSG